MKVGEEAAFSQYGDFIITIYTFPYGPGLLSSGGVMKGSWKTGSKAKLGHRQKVFAAKRGGKCLSDTFFLWKDNTCHVELVGSELVADATTDRSQQ